MSRKWERMVERNRKSVNLARKKQGKERIEDDVKDSTAVIKGRSWMLPSILVFFGVLFFVTSFIFNNVVKDLTYWFTGFGYIGLGILICLVRRPVIRISRSHIIVRRFTGDKMIEPKEIEFLTLNPGHIVIQLKEKNKKYIYTKLQHRFPMDTLHARLREFAVQHRLDVKG